jgi:hypothetical protein
MRLKRDTLWQSYGVLIWQHDGLPGELHLLIGY